MSSSPFSTDSVPLYDGIRPFIAVIVVVGFDAGGAGAVCTRELELGDAVVELIGPSGSSSWPDDFP